MKYGGIFFGRDFYSFWCEYLDSSPAIEFESILYMGSWAGHVEGIGKVEGMERMSPWKKMRKCIRSIFAVFLGVEKKDCIPFFLGSIYVLEERAD